MIVVSDASPLHYLVLIGNIELLPRLFGRVFTPPAVVRELTDPRTPDPVRQWAESVPEWLQIRDPRSVDETLGLHPGETQAIALAHELHADLLLIDERDGRRKALERGLRVVGTLAVLGEAADRGLIELRAALDSLQRTNFRISQKLVDEFLRRDRERLGG